MSSRNPTARADQAPTSEVTSLRASRVPRRSAGLPVVLLVDDSPDNLFALEAMLRRADVEIVSATSGREALEILLERDVAVAIIDVMMPEMDGFELAELIRGAERTRRVPIIFVTAASKAEYRAFAGYGLGAIDFLFKPLDDRILRAKVDVLVALDRQQREAERARAETEVLLGLAQAISQAEKPADIYDPALDAVRDLLGAERSAILLFDASARMRFRTWRGLSDAYRAAVDGHSPWTRDEKSVRSILIGDVTATEAMAPFRSIFAAEGIAAIAFVPLSAEGQLFGKFMLYWAEPRTFSSHDEDLVVAIAAQVSEAIERAQLREAKRQAHDRLGQLQRVTSILNRAATPDAVAASLPLICEAVGASTCGLMALSPDGRELLVLGSVGIAPEVVERFRRHSVESDVTTSEAIRAREPVFVESRDERDRRYGHLGAEILTQFDGTQATAPLLVDDRVLGALSFGFSSWRVIAPVDRAFILAVAGQCAHALDRTRLLDAERRARRHAEATEGRRAFLVDATAALASSLDYDVTLRNIAELAVPRFADWCAVDIAEGPEGQPTRVAVVHTDPTKVELALELRRRYPPDPHAPHGIPNVLRTGRSELYREIPDELLAASCRDEEHLRIARELGMRSAVTVPIAVRGRPLGVITFVTAESDRGYDDHDLEVAQEIGRRAGIAIENARLFDAERRGRDLLQETNEALRLAEKKLRAALTAGSMGVWQWHLPTGHVEWSPELEAIHGLEPGTFEGTYEAYQRDIHPDDRDILLRTIQDALAAGRDHEVEYRIVLPDGQVRWVAGYGSVVTREDGEPGAMTGVCFDITERKRAEQALRDSEARYRTLFEVSVYGIITIDEEGVIQTANPAAERMFGYTAGEVTGRNVASLMPEPYRSQHDVYLRNYRRTGERKIIGVGREVVGRRKDGSTFPMDLAVSEFRVAGKRHFKGIVNDITERKALERAREAAVTELTRALHDNEMFAAVLAHDLRNPLGAILMATQLVLHRNKGVEDSSLAPLHRVVSSSERMTRMIEQLLDFTRARHGRGFELEPRDTDLAKICSQVRGEIELAHPEWKVAADSRGDLVGTWDPDRLAQVLSNLLTNAGRHGAQGTAILVKLDGTDPDSVSIEVHNHGAIPEALLPNIFSPFRGTRQRGASGGLGLGLYITIEIVRSHGGTLEVSSSEAAGTTFRAKLPRRTPRRPSGDAG